MNDTNFVLPSGKVLTLALVGDRFVMSGGDTGTHSISADSDITTTARLQAHWNGYIENNGGKLVREPEAMFTKDGWVAPAGIQKTQPLVLWKKFDVVCTPAFPCHGNRPFTVRGVMAHSKSEANAVVRKDYEDTFWGVKYNLKAFPAK